VCAPRSLVGLLGWSRVAYFLTNEVGASAFLSFNIISPVVSLLLALQMHHAIIASRIESHAKGAISRIP
jgi:hypothetical protein